MVAVCSVKNSCLLLIFAFGQERWSVAAAIANEALDAGVGEVETRIKRSGNKDGRPQAAVRPIRWRVRRAEPE